MVAVTTMKGFMMGVLAIQHATNVFSLPWGAATRSISFRVNYIPRGGGGDQTVEEAATTTEVTKELSLDEKVHAAMRKLGLTPATTSDDDDKDETNNDKEECEGGVCPMPSATQEVQQLEQETQQNEQDEPQQTLSPQEDVHVVAARISKDMNVDERLAMAALGATSVVPGDTTQSRRFNESAARDLIQQELTLIDAVSEDSDDVKQLVSEGHDAFLCRRALAFAEMNMDDARAILVADQMDAEEERQEQEGEEKRIKAQIRAEEEAARLPLKTVKVNANFDPTAGAGLSTSTSPPRPSNPMKPPSPAKKSDVVFEATAAQVQDLVLESSVPVLLDVYADWCGPCKALTPVLEEMAVKGGGVFRLVKINSDNERAISTALEVTALPSVFAIRDGKVVHMFQGMPRGEEAMKNFMMGLLMPGAKFDPPVTPSQQQNYDALSSKLAKTAGSAGFSFSARERLQDRTAVRLDELVKAYSGDMVDAEDSAKVLRSLMSNVIRDPFDRKFRNVNLKNKVLADKIAAYAPCLAILKSVGFVMNQDGTSMMLGTNKKVVNVAPLTVARDCIDKWIDKNRYLVAAATRKRKDEVERRRLAEEAEAASEDTVDDDEEEDEEEEVDPNATTIKVRLEGKKKVHDLVLQADDPLSAVIDKLPVTVEEGEEFQITCAAKRLIVKSSDSGAMQKSLSDHGLAPAASLVIKIGDSSKSDSSSSLAERAASQKNLKQGSHTMQSVGIYSKDDNAKAELIDGGGGVWYEHDVSDDEVESPEEPSAEAESGEANADRESEEEGV